MEIEGIRKPSVGDGLLAARTRAFERGDVLRVRLAEQHFEKRQTTRHLARHHRKQRKRALAECCREMENRKRILDPPSSDKGAPCA